MGLVTAEMRASLGGVVARRVSYPVCMSDIRKWALAVYYPDPPPDEFMEESSDALAPEEFNPFAWAVAEQWKPDTSVALRDYDAMEKALGIVGPGLKNRVAGSIRVEYHLPLRVGDIVTSVTRLIDYFERDGRLGRMLFTVTEDRWTDSEQKHLKTLTETSIRY
jgi:hydroxyacyl-ACP dehydratase HTD2-like protein with hotdog domain